MKLLIMVILMSISIPAGACELLFGDHEDALKNHHKINENISSSGKPTDDQLKKLAHHDYKTIIDLRTTAEGTSEEKALVEELGMEYINIPVTGEGINDDQLKAFTEAIESAKTPVLVHCASGNRVGAMWTTYQMSKGVASNEALAQGRAIGMKPSLEEKVKSNCKAC